MDLNFVENETTRWKVHVAEMCFKMFVLRRNISQILVHCQGKSHLPPVANNHIKRIPWNCRRTETQEVSLSIDHVFNQWFCTLEASGTSLFQNSPKNFSEGWPPHELAPNHDGSQMARLKNLTDRLGESPSAVKTSKKMWPQNFSIPTSQQKMVHSFLIH